MFDLLIEAIVNSNDSGTADATISKLMHVEPDPGSGSVNVSGLIPVDNGGSGNGE